MAEEVLVKDIKTNKIIHLDKGETVLAAANLMKKNSISSIIVLEKNAVAGIVTERDIIYKIICAEADPKNATIEQIMSKPVQTIDSSQNIVEAARKMRDLKIKKLLVTEGREVKGIISEHDILEIDPALHTP